MLYRKFHPSPCLRDLIECHFVWDSEGENCSGRVFDSPPSGFTSIVFNYAEPYSLTNRKHELLMLPEAFVAGQSLYRYSLTMSGTIGMVGSVFKPAGLYTLFGIDMASIVEERQSISAFLCGEKTGVLLSEIRGAADPESRAGLLDAFFVSEVEKRKPVPDVFDRCASHVASSHGMVSLHSLTEETGLGRRTFERGFLRKVGMSPKKYVRMCRISYVCNRISGKRKVDWLSVIGDTEFYDQAHFIRDFRLVMGESPSVYLADNQELANAVDKPRRWSVAVRPRG